MNVGLSVEQQRARAEVLLAAVLELRELRGRLTRVTVDDMALVLAMLDAEDYEPAPSAPGDSLDVERALRIVFSQYAVVPDRERIDGPHVVIVGNAHEAARHLAPMVVSNLRSEPTGA